MSSISLVPLYDHSLRSCLSLSETSDDAAGKGAWKIQWAELSLPSHPSGQRQRLRGCVMGDGEQLAPATTSAAPQRQPPFRLSDATISRRPISKPDPQIFPLLLLGHKEFSMKPYVLVESEVEKAAGMSSRKKKSLLARSFWLVPSISQIPLESEG